MKDQSGLKLSPRNRPQELIATVRQGKAHERSQLNEFFVRLNLAPTLKDRERPDFTALFGAEQGSEMSLGCETTQFFNDESRKGSRSAAAVATWRRFNEQIPRKLKSSVGVTLFFHGDSQRTQNGNLEAFAKDKDAQDQLFHLLEGIDGERRIPVSMEPTIAPNLASYVTEVSAAPTQDSRYWWAGHFQSGELPDPRPTLERIVAKKSSLSNDFQQNHFNETWLVIVADALQIGSHCHLDEKAPSMPFSETGTFDRIWLWDGFMERIWQLYPDWKLVLDGTPASLQQDVLPNFLRAYLGMR